MNFFLLLAPSLLVSICLRSSSVTRSVLQATDPPSSSLRGWNLLLLNIRLRALPTIQLDQDLGSVMFHGGWRVIGFRLCSATRHVSLKNFPVSRPHHHLALRKRKPSPDDGRNPMVLIPHRMRPSIPWISRRKQQARNRPRMRSALQAVFSLQAECASFWPLLARC
jgi:hypothetical protein